MTNYDNIWKQKKEDILSGIDKLIEEGFSDRELLEIMRELAQKARVNQSMEDFIDEQLN